jgi:hypothetical protein
VSDWSAGLRFDAPGEIVGHPYRFMCGVNAVAGSCVDVSGRPPNALLEV